MVPTLSRQEERRGTRRLWWWGIGAAVVLFAASLVWLFMIVPKGEFGVRMRGPSGLTGTLANQDSGQSTAARRDQVLPEKSPTGGAGQSSSGQAAQIDQAAAPLKLSDAQRQRVASYFSREAGDRLQSADFALSIGAAVPAQIPLQKLPGEVSSAMGGYQGDDYVLVGKQLVIVDAGARRVVAIVPNIG